MQPMQTLLQSACSALAPSRPAACAAVLQALFLLVQGHFQIMFNPKVSPLFQRKLSWPMRIMYCSGVWSYLIGAISTPTFIIIPLVSTHALAMCQKGHHVLYGGPTHFSEVTGRCYTLPDGSQVAVHTW